MKKWMFLADASNQTVLLIIVVAVVVLIMAIIFWFINVGNTFRKMQVKIDEAESGIDVALTKRYDMLTKMYQVTKGYAKHEQETLQKVISMRKPQANSSILEKEEYSKELNSAIKELNVVVERYPELKADKNFGKLQEAVSDVEDQLQASRRIYNSNVSIYNQLIVSFPKSIVANMHGFTKRDFFQAEETKKQDVNLDF